MQPRPLGTAAISPAFPRHHSNHLNLSPHEALTANGGGGEAWGPGPWGDARGEVTRLTPGSARTDPGQVPSHPDQTGHEGTVCLTPGLKG